MDILTETKEDLIKRFAYNIYRRRIAEGLEGDEKSDYFEAIEEYLHYERLHNIKGVWV